ncbi:hypothetical protein [Candidatus Coxiella mudrowiae]|uniref:hypothetical protein n=1 Tax=Candidatus Coxiella mudrowiae TaxID=2054173 RepID=UPI001F226084|nr:hypothetical protein [Candidatus Coxiella mudrowiae]
MNGDLYLKISVNVSAKILVLKFMKLFICSKTLPKTMNGKIQRQTFQAAYRDNKLIRLASCDHFDQITIWQ